MLVLLGLPKTKHRGPTQVVTAVPLSHNYRESNNALLLTYGGGSIVTSSVEEGITYTTRSKTLRGRSNMCIHKKILTQYGGDPTTFVRTTHHPPGDPGNNNYYMDANHHVTSAGFHSSACTAAKAAFPIPFGPAFLSTNAEAYINTAFAELKPDLTEMNLPEFLIEVDQLKGLLGSWKSHVQDALHALRNLWAQPKQFAKTLKKTRVSAKQTARNAATEHLSWKYGALPLISDVEGLLDAFLHTKRAIEEWRKSSGLLFHRSKQMLSSSESVSGASTFGAETRCEWRGTLKRTVTAHIIYRALPIVAINDMDVKIRGYLDAFGIELNPVIIWDEIPFSFVVDWFVNVGSWIERFKIDALELPIGLADSYLQYKEEFRCESSTIICYGRSDFNPWPRSGGWTTSETTFQRMPIFPGSDTFQSLHWKTPSLNHAVLGVSLATVLGLKGK